ncbi:hypothetical protein [Arthrobacter sp. H14-L1]|uniref:hypothetical protein n=1 Tax=Arthrobacter sp. H14-L1 TaxID=2996697 RepID=UPI00226FAEE8|nr:hypothetical protein [Arthrobacter sp. H14-L1]MCY0905774.1 hypothetical protein [Arthrobacter sp. H14-L1]
MNTHGRHAMETMQNHDPETFSQVQNPEEYFSTLGSQIEDQIGNVMDSLIQRDTRGRSTLEILGERNMARLRAREMVYQEMIYSSLPPEPEEMEDFTPLTDGTDSELDRENSQQ